MEKPIRVLCVVATMNCGGTENFIMNVYRKINREKVQFDFIVNDKNEGFFYEEIKKLGGKIYYIPRLNSKNFFTVKKQWYEFFKNHSEYKVLHAHLSSYASLFLPIAKKFGLKTIVHSHSSDDDKNIFSIIKTILQFPLRYQADHFFACSESAAKWLYGKKIASQKALVLSNGIDTEKYVANNDAKSRLISEYKLENKFVVGHVGRFNTVKNHDFLIEVFNELSKIKDNAVLLLLGEGNLKPQIEKKAIEYGLADKVIFAGLRSNVADFLQVMDCFVFPSFSEGLGIAIIEAECCGLPCFINETLPSELDINDNVCRISLNEAPTVWAQAMVDKAQKIDSDIARQNIIDSGYDIAVTTKTLEEFYQSIINEGEIK